VKTVEVFSWWRPADIWNRKPHLSKFKLTREDAAKMWPGAEPDLSTREVRYVPEDNAEALRNQISGKAGHPPG